jgi:hypothetical protein
LLADYISSTTALNLTKYISQHSSEVNILSFGYNENLLKNMPIIELRNMTFYARQIAEHGGTASNQGFIDIVKVGAPPS